MGVWGWEIGEGIIDVLKLLRNGGDGDQSQLLESTVEFTGAYLVAQMVKNPPVMQETQV